MTDASGKTASTALLPFEARYAAGKKRRAEVSRESQGEFSAPARDPVAIFAETNKGRLPNLIPIRRQRMSASPFAFLRGAAALMAVDLAAQKAPGFPVQACGDCHLMNFGAFLSPEGEALFDINDFDETLPGVDFTIDLKRLAASCAVAALSEGDSPKKARAVAKEAVKAYRERMSVLAELSPYEAWHARVDLKREAADLFGGDVWRRRCARRPRTRAATARTTRISRISSATPRRATGASPMIRRSSITTTTWRTRRSMSICRKSSRASSPHCRPASARCSRATASPIRR